MATFDSFTPEKDKEEQRDEIGQSVPELSTPKAAPVAEGGQAVGSAGATTGSKPTSSGSFQDFSKFKEANKAKLTALGNLAVNKERTDVGAGIEKGRQAISEASRGFDQYKPTMPAAPGGRPLTSSEIIANKGAYENIFNAGIGDEAKGAAREKVTMASEEAGKALQDIQGMARNRAGIQAGLRSQRGGGATGTAAADALLLQSSPEFRRQAQQAAQELTGNVEGFQKTGASDLEKAIGAAESGISKSKNLAESLLRSSGRDIETGLDARVANKIKELSAQGQKDWMKSSTDAFTKALMDRIAKEKGTLTGSTDPRDTLSASRDASVGAFNEKLDSLLKDPNAVKAMLGGKSMDEFLKSQKGYEAAGAGAKNLVTRGHVATDADRQALEYLSGRGLSNAGLLATPASAPTYQVSGLQGAEMSNLMKSLEGGIANYIKGLRTAAPTQQVQQIKPTGDVRSGIFG